MVEKFDEKANPYFKSGLSEVSIEQVVAAFGAGCTGGSTRDLNALAAFPIALHRQPVTRLTVTFANDQKREMIVGGVASSTTRVEQTRPMFPGQPPQPRIITEETRYAKIGDNPLVFELKDDHFNELFFAKPSDPPPARSAASQLRDPQLIRFEPSQVKSVEIEWNSRDAEGKPVARVIELRKIPGDRKAGDADAKKDRWEVVRPAKFPAEATAVNDLLDLLKGFSASGSDLIDRGPLAVCRPALNWRSSALPRTRPDTLRSTPTPDRSRSWSANATAASTASSSCLAGSNGSTVYPIAATPSSNRNSIVRPAPTGL
jgi:hypothetical protein